MRTVLPLQSRVRRALGSAFGLRGRRSVESCLHLGVYKTGTTAIQRYFLRNRAAILREQGLLYPTAGIYPTLPPGHALLANRFRSASGAKRTPEAHAALVDMVGEIGRQVRRESASRLLLSSEVFLPSMDIEDEYLDPALVKSFPLFGRPTLILFLRPQWELAISKYKQVVKSPHWRWQGSFDDFLAKWAPTVNYHEVLGPWLDAFGRESFRLTVYGSGMASVSEFLRLARLSPLPGQKEAMANVSFSLAAIERLRDYWRAEGDADIGSDRIDAMLRDWEDQLSDDERKEAEARFASANAEVLADFRETCRSRWNVALAADLGPAQPADFARML